MALVLFFVGGLVAGRSIGLSHAWTVAMIAQAGIVLLARFGVAIFNLIL